MSLSLGSLLATPRQCREMLALIEDYDIHIESSVGLVAYPMLNVQTYPFARVNEMIADAKLGKVDGRLVLTF